MAGILTPGQRKRKQFNIALRILVTVYVVGIAGLLSPYKESFLRFTPINLLLTAAIMLWFHGGWSRRFSAFAAIVIFLGYLVEVIGVKTGLIFGDYVYGTHLGGKVWDVPPVIGVNWLLLVYAIGCVVGRFQVKTPLVKAVISACFITVLDFIIEPVAIKLDFWHWTAGTVPVQNYAGWLLVSFIFFYSFFRLRLQDLNPMAPIVALLQVVFFGILYILL